MSDEIPKEPMDQKPAATNSLPSVSISSSSSTLLPSTYTPTSMLRQPSPSTSAPLFSSSASSSAMQFGLGPAPEEVPMLPSTSRATFAPSGELLIDGLGVDGRNLSKGEMGWAEPFSPVVTTTPTIRRFSTRPSLDPIAHSSSFPPVSPLLPIAAPPMSAAPSASLMLPDPVTVFPVDDFGTCGVHGCSGEGFQASERTKGTSHSSITIHDIVERRTCRPISLQDLRTRLLVQRASRKDAPSSPFATQAQLPDLSLLGGAKKPTHAAGRHEIGVEEMDQEKTLTNYSADLDTTPSTRKPSQQSAGQSTLVPTQRAASAAGKLVGKLNKHARSASTGDEVDALDFVAVFNRYNRRFYALSKAQRARSPNPASYALASEEDGSTLRRATTTAAASPTSEQPRQLGEQGVKVEVLVRQTSTVPSASQGGFRPMSRLDSAATVTGRKEITLYPSSQPLREQFEDILRRFIGALQDDDGRRESETGNTTLSVEEKDEAHKSTSMSKSTSRTCCPASPRLRWMVDIGLLCEQQISLALAEAEVTTHPQVLAPIADKVAAYLNAHIVPGFLSASTSNLSRTTQLGRLGVGLICLGLAILFTVLLAVNPSPFRPRDASDVSRWWRLLTAPLWCAGVGYVLAAWTGVCVWLTIRGNHEPGQDEGPEDDGPWQSEWEQLSADEHHQPAPSKKKDPTWTLSNPAINAPDPALPWRRPDKKSLMAPELLNILRRFAFLKPLPVAGPEMQQVTSDSLEKGPDFRIEPATSSGILFSNPSWGMPSSTNAHRDSMEERVSPTVSRAASLSGITVAAPGPRQLEPVHEAEKWSPGSSTNIAAVGSTEMSSIGQVASVIDGAIGISVPPPAPPITPRMPSSSGGSFNTPPFSPRSVSPNGGMWRNSSMGSVSVISPTSMSAPAISVRAKKVPVLPVAVGLVKTNVPSPANIHRSPTTSRVSISPFAGGRDEGPARSGAAAASQADAAGMSYAASLYNVATCGPRHSAPRRLASSVWVTIRRATGFAVNTKPVLDSRVRAAQQRAALQSLSICFGITLVILIIIVAVP